MTEEKVLGLLGLAHRAGAGGQAEAPGPHAKVPVLPGRGETERNPRRAARNSEPPKGQENAGSEGGTAPGRDGGKGTRGHARSHAYPGAARAGGRGARLRLGPIFTTRS